MTIAVITIILINREQVLCHCLECRKVSGSAFTINVVILKSNLHLTGEVKTCNWKQEIGDNFTSSFCPNCGTTVCKETTREDFKGLIMAEGGTLDEGFEEVTKPEAELFTKHRAAWLCQQAGAAQVAGAP